MHRMMPHSMRIGPVQLWLLLLLADKPMYGYEMINELEKRFSSFWKPRSGTIYPALESLEKGGFVTSRVKSQKSGPDRKYYSVTPEGDIAIRSLMKKWSKMTEMVDNYRETHESIFRFKAHLTKKEVSRILANLGHAVGKETFDMGSVLPSSERISVSITEPVAMKLLYAKENHKKEFHIEIEWNPQDAQS